MTVKMGELMAEGTDELMPEELGALVVWTISKLMAERMDELMAEVMGELMTSGNGVLMAERMDVLIADENFVLGLTACVN